MKGAGSPPEEVGRPSADPERRMTDLTMDSLAWASFGAVGQVLLQVGVLLVLARLLTPEDFGVVALATLILGFTTFFWKLGVGPALVQRPMITTAHVETAFTCSLLLGATFMAGVLLSAPMIGRFFDAPRLIPVLRVTTIVYLLGGSIVVAESLLQRHMRFKLIAVIQLASYFMYGLVSIVAAVAGAHVWALVLGLVAQSATEAVLVLKSQPHTKRLRLQRRAFGQLLSFGGGNTIGEIANYCALQGDNFVTGRLLGTSALGLYGRAYNLMAMPANLFASAVDTVLFPAMARVQSEPARVAVAFRRSMAMTALIALPGSALTFVLAPEAVAVLLGDQWTPVVPILRILALGVFFRTGYKLAASVARAHGKVYQMAWRQAVYAILVVAGSWAGAHAYGIRGVAFAVLVALAVTFALFTSIALHLTNQSIFALMRVLVAPTWLALLTLAAAQSLALLLRGADSPPLLTSIGVLAATLSLVTLAARTWPNVFLGDEGRWGMRTLWTFTLGKLGKRQLPDEESSPR